MGFKKLFGGEPTVIQAAPAATTAPATVTSSTPVSPETQEVDLRSDYAQRSSRKRGLLSTILSNRTRSAGLGSSSGGNATLG